MQYKHKYLKSINHIDESVIAILKSYNWPGNVRELFHIVEYALNVIENDTWKISHLPKYITNSYNESNDKLDNFNYDERPDIFESDLQYIMDNYESKILKKVLEHNGYNISRAADSLGIKRQSLQYRIKKYGIVI
jgi:arginine utilization regulatory protein